METADAAPTGVKTGAFTAESPEPMRPRLGRNGDGRWGSSGRQDRGIYRWISRADATATRPQWRRPMRLQRPSRRGPHPLFNWPVWFIDYLPESGRQRAHSAMLHRIKWTPFKSVTVGSNRLGGKWAGLNGPIRRGGGTQRRPISGPRRPSAVFLTPTPSVGWAI